MSALNRDSVSILDRLAEVGGKAKSVIQGMNKREAQEELEISRPNFIINGDHQVNQRGLLPVTGSGNSYESTDRWGSVTSVVSGNLTLTNGWLKHTATSSATGQIGLRQYIEDISSLAGQTITVTARVKSNTSNALLGLEPTGGTGAFCNHSGSGDEELLTITTTLAAATTAMGVNLRICSNGYDAVSITSGDYIEFTNVKLEIGDTATPFEVEPYAEVLRKCRRYWYQPDASGNAYSYHGDGYAATTTVAYIFVPVQLRAIADTIDYSTLALNDGTSTFALTDLSINSRTTADMVVLLATVASGLTAFRPYNLINNAATSGYLGFGNEL